MKALVTCLFLLAQAVAPTGLLAQEDRPTTGDPLEDARLVVTSAGGEVRIWHKPPRVLVLADRQDVLTEIERIGNVLEDRIAPSYGPYLFESWTYASFPEDFGEVQNAEYSFVINARDSGETYVQVNLGADVDEEVDLVIAVGSRSEIAVLNGLWGLPLSYQRAQMSGRTWPCFYSSRSRNGERLGGFVSIVDQGQESNDLDVCLWEEILHSMGPLIDADGSEFYSFDEMPTQSLVKMENDILLLRSLYESGIERGDNADKAISYLRELLFSE